MEQRENDWRSALAAAARSQAGTRPGSLLFLEDREDLAVSAGTSARLRTRHSRICGLSARGPFESGRSAHVSNPEPAEAAPLFRFVTSPDQDAPPPRPATDSPKPERRLDPSEATALLSRLVSQARRRLPGAEVQTGWIGFDQQVWIAQPSRPLVEDRRRSSRIWVEIELTRRGARSRARIDAVVPRDAEARDLRFRELVEEVAERAELRIDAREPNCGPITTVMAPGVAGVLVHELIGHALEADVASGGSWLSGAQGRVATDGLAVLDDPRRARAAWRWDDEAELARATPLVREGRVESWLHDQRSSRDTGRPSTGHGRRASFREPVRPRMGCTFVGAGDLSPSEVVAGIREGIYVRRMEAAVTDPRTGRAVFRVTDADRLLNGRREAPVAPHMIALDGKAVLETMDRIGNDLAFDTCIGSCLRDGQALPISVGAPTIRIGSTTLIS